MAARYANGVLLPETRRTKRLVLVCHIDKLDEPKRIGNTQHSRS
jgi:hypothetical protein